MALSRSMSCTARLAASHTCLHNVSANPAVLHIARGSHLKASSLASTSAQRLPDPRRRCASSSSKTTLPSPSTRPAGTSRPPPQDKAYHGYFKPRNASAGSLSLSDVGREVVIAGWLASSRRVNSELSFHSLRDSTGSVQLKAQHSQGSGGGGGGGGGEDDTLLSLPLESVVHIEGIVEARPEGTILSKDLPSGSIEVRVTSWQVLNPAKAQLPFYPEKEHELPKSEETRIQYRYLDLRRKSLTDNLRLRSLVAHTVRDQLFRQGFTEVETPLLLRSTPEGAREFLVPTRSPSALRTSTDVSEGSSAYLAELVTQVPTFYALPQSPQQPKQILMASGVTDKYYQFAKCFRDESSRKDRQPEFTQIDLEMAFVSGQGEPGDTSGWRMGGSEVRRVVEGMVRSIWQAARGVDVLPDGEDGSSSGFRVMTYEAAMRRFGVDKPDVRFALEIVDLAAGLKKHYFKGDVDDEVGNEEDVKLMKEKAGTLEVLAFRGPRSGQAFSRKEAIELTRDKSGGTGHLERFKALHPAPHAIAQLLLLKSALLRSYLSDTGLSPDEVDVEVLAKQIQLALEKGRFDLPQAGQSSKVGAEMDEEVQIWIQRRGDPSVGDSTELGDLRVRLRDAVLHKGWSTLPTHPHFLWITEFPLFTRADSDKAALSGGRWASTHHPFTAPMHSHLPALQRILSTLASIPSSSPDEQGKVLAGFESWLRRIRGQHYDLVLNGVEIGGGSVRIHSAHLQESILRSIHQLSSGEVGRFAHLLGALDSGCPPHAGIALGFDRLVSLLTEKESASIRDVIAFPKIGAAGRDPLFGSPSPIGEVDKEAALALDGEKGQGKGKSDRRRPKIGERHLRKQSSKSEEQDLRLPLQQEQGTRQQLEERSSTSAAAEEEAAEEEDVEEEEEDGEDEGKGEEANPTSCAPKRSSLPPLSPSQQHQQRTESLLLEEFALCRLAPHLEEERIQVRSRFRKISRAKAKRARRVEEEERLKEEEREREERMRRRGLID
ncbi:hypothetical protein BCV69DRAFT_261384 [Microstroma glucosiphilum]|uniref:Aminoacyl-transfer RNA synthetases class-II family profile domain-containing protein n=1 Tax=Pseudomicrostroma glucosiphilum TaxID=1684307 RepID=A0A316U3H6_9BASI|nr:hypothetical protein BCV69DRAFT_261384 [Pseudomicrostroma glucosiphilum]PWN19852.1 hypothetical protein BCV69DRAFT_261384 [Pseudomicrostroma glucosiphilum]